MSKITTTIFQGNCNVYMEKRTGSDIQHEHITVTQIDTTVTNMMKTGRDKSR